MKVARDKMSESGSSRKISEFFSQKPTSKKPRIFERETKMSDGDSPKFHDNSTGKEHFPSSSQFFSVPKADDEVPVLRSPSERNTNYPPDDLSHENSSPEFIESSLSQQPVTSSGNSGARSTGTNGRPRTFKTFDDKDRERRRQNVAGNEGGEKGKNFSRYFSPKKDAPPDPGHSVWTASFHNRKKKPVYRRTEFDDDTDSESQNYYQRKKSQSQVKRCERREKKRENVELEPFRSALTEMGRSSAKKGKIESTEQVILSNSTTFQSGTSGYGQSSKLLGGKLKVPYVGVHHQFKPPVRQGDSDGSGSQESRTPELARSSGSEGSTAVALQKDGGGGQNKSMIDQKLIDIIESEIIDKNLETDWTQVAGLDGVKKALKEIVVWPFLRPEIFTGIRAPPKGVLLFGPPGTGKTMIGKCVASQCKATFFNISASSMTSKWVGEGEKLVRALFAVARERLPSVIFIDEIDSLLSARNEGEHESSRRIKTEFLVQMEGLGTSSEERLLVLGATNRPQELDEAARRRFSQRLYVALPVADARVQMIKKDLEGHHVTLSEEAYSKIGELTDGFSGSDMWHLCRAASMFPLRDANVSIESMDAEAIRGIQFKDFKKALKSVRPSVASSDLSTYEEWDRKFGMNLKEHCEDSEDSEDLED